MAPIVPVVDFHTPRVYIGALTSASVYRRRSPQRLSTIRPGGSMDSFGRRSPWVVVVIAILMFPAAVFAQDATLSGTVTDTTGAVLPGVTITATNQDTGNTFVAISDGSGEFRLPLRI